jgi:hypothetical protein
MGYHYENNELTDMLLKYGQCYQNIAAASREYEKRFLERFHPGPRQFINLVLCRPKNFGRHCLSIQKKKIVIRTLLSS